MDSSIVLFVVVLSTVLGQIRLPCLQEIRLHCFSVDSSSVAYKAWLYGSLFCYFVWGFSSSSTLWIRPLFCLLWFYPLFQGRFVYPAYRRFVSIVLVWIRPLWLIKLGFMAVINLRLDLFWHKKEAAASTVCLTGFPYRFFWFSHDWFFC